MKALVKVHWLSGQCLEFIGTLSQFGGWYVVLSSQLLFAQTKGTFSYTSILYTLLNTGGMCLCAKAFFLVHTVVVQRVANQQCGCVGLNYYADFFGR